MTKIINKILIVSLAMCLLSIASKADDKLNKSETKKPKDTEINAFMFSALSRNKLLLEYY